MHELVTEEKHKAKKGKGEQGTPFAISTRILGLKIGIVSFRQRTPFPSGTMARRTVGRYTSAWLLKAAMRRSSNGIRKRGVEDAGRKKRDLAPEIPCTEIQRSNAPCYPRLSRSTTTGGHSGRWRWSDKLPASVPLQTAAVRSVGGRRPSRPFPQTRAIDSTEGRAQSGKRIVHKLLACSLEAWSRALPCDHCSPGASGSSWRPVQPVY